MRMLDGLRGQANVGPALLLFRREERILSQRITEEKDMSCTIRYSSCGRISYSLLGVFTSREQSRKGRLLLDSKD